MFQLMDMGFSREHALEALLNTSTMEQATEYLLTHPPPLLGGAVRVRINAEVIHPFLDSFVSLGQLTCYMILSCEGSNHV